MTGAVGRVRPADQGGLPEGATSGRRSDRPMFQTILIGYDGPERGGEAVALAAVLRDPRHGRMVLTSVYPRAPLRAGGFVGREIEELGDETEEMLADARDALAEPARVQIRAVASDSPARALTEVAEAEHADLIVVGSSRHSALGRLLPGTTAEHLLRDAPCPVAVAPPGYTGGDIRRIGVAYDGSPEADATLRAAESLTLAHSAGLTVCCVAGPTAPSAGMIATGAERRSRAAANALATRCTERSSTRRSDSSPRRGCSTVCPRRRSQAGPTA